MNINDSAAEPPAAAGERLHKVLAAAGIGSRRHCEELISAGRVQVDGQFVTALGVRVDPLRQRIAVDTVDIPRPKLEYYLLNKPTGVVCTNFDPDGRTRVIDLLPSDAKRVYTVGRLDRNSEGLVLLTNDGELAHRLMHPRFEVAKVYDVQVAGDAGRDVADQLLRGVHLAEGVARASHVQVKSSHGRSTVLRITLKEGKNREIRRLLARTGHKVMQLRRVALGPLKLQDLPSGQFRRLHEAEVRQLQEAAGPSSTEADSGAERGEGSSPRSRDTFRRDKRPSGRPRSDQRRPPADARRTGPGRPPRKPMGQERRPQGAARKPLGRRPPPQVPGLGTIIGGEEGLPAATPRGKRPRPPVGATAHRPGKRPRPGGNRFRDESSADRPAPGRKFSGKKFAAKPTGRRPAGGKFSGRPGGGKTRYESNDPPPSPETGDLTEQGRTGPAPARNRQPDGARPPRKSSARKSTGQRFTERPPQAGAGPGKKVAGKKFTGKKFAKGPSGKKFAGKKAAGKKHFPKKPRRGGPR